MWRNEFTDLLHLKQSSVDLYDQVVLKLPLNKISLFDNKNSLV